MHPLVSRRQESALMNEAMLSKNKGTIGAQI
jgi:hypothetical protein